MIATKFVRGIAKTLQCCTATAQGALILVGIAVACLLYLDVDRA